MHHAEQQDGRKAMLRDFFFFFNAEQEADRNDGSVLHIVVPRLLSELQSFICINIKPVACCRL